MGRKPLVENLQHTGPCTPALDFQGATQAPPASAEAPDCLITLSIFLLDVSTVKKQTINKKKKKGETRCEFRLRKHTKDMDCWQRKPALAVCFAAETAALSLELMELTGRGEQDVSSAGGGRVRSY